MAINIQVLWKKILMKYYYILILTICSYLQHVFMNLFMFQIGALSTFFFLHHLTISMSNMLKDQIETKTNKQKQLDLT